MTVKEFPNDNNEQKLLYIKCMLISVNCLIYLMNTCVCVCVS